MSRKINVYRQVDLLQARAEQLPFVSSLLVCLEFSEVRRTLKFGQATHARALHQLRAVGESFWTTPSKPLQALLKQAYRAVIIHAQAQVEAERARQNPVIQQARFMRQLRKGLHIGAAGVRAA